MCIYRSVLIERFEVLLHSNFGGQDYWEVNSVIDLKTANFSYYTVVSSNFIVFVTIMARIARVVSLLIL